MMAKFSIGELVEIKDGSMRDDTCVVIGYGRLSKFSGEQRYHLRLYGGGVIDVPFSECNLDR